MDFATIDTTDTRNQIIDPRSGFQKKKTRMIGLLCSSSLKMARKYE